MTNNIMLDLETLSSAPDAVIVSIGAVTFRVDGEPTIAEERKLFSIIVDGASAQEAGGHIDARTVAWWLQQSDAARASLQASQPTHINVALQSFAHWVSQFEKPTIWGNGAGFDNVILRRAYERSHLITPWGNYQDRCYRTLKNLARHIPISRIGVAHSALDDALSQAVHAEAIFADMRGEA